MPSPSQPTGGSRPRALVIDHAWRGLGAGLEPLSGPDGAPLTRTVKLIVLPLIVRPALRPDLAADFLPPAQAGGLDALIRESAALLAATARWFILLKKARRALGVVAGNPQDLYFQRCFELAAEHGVPAAGADATARDVVEEIAHAPGGRTVEALKDHVSDAVRRSRLEAELATAWGSRSPADANAARTAIERAAEVLDACGAPGRASASPSYAAMIEAGHGEMFGRALWAHASGLWGRDDLPAPRRCSGRP